MSNNKIIDNYLNDTDKLYEEWYSKQLNFDTGVEYGEPVGSFDDYKRSFQNWLDDNKKTLQKAICPNLNKIKKEKKKVDIILGILSCIEDLSIIACSIEISILIFLYGLDKLCTIND